LFFCIVETLEQRAQNIIIWGQGKVTKIQLWQSPKLYSIRSTALPVLSYKIVYALSHGDKI
jgi:hypothetical protein